MRKKRFFSNTIILLFIILFSLFIYSCNEPVFYKVSMQTKELPPRINGSPTGFAEINQVMYVATDGIIHIYDTLNETWNTTAPNAGRITFLAGTASNIFILTNNGVYVSTSLNPLSFEPLTADPSYRYLSMYSAVNQVFIGVRKTDDNSYHVLRYDGTTYSGAIPTGRGILNGAAYNGASFFLSVKDVFAENGGGIYQENGTLIADNIPFMGIISIDSNIYAITRNGIIYSVTSGSILHTNTLGKLSNGSLYLWTDPYDHSNRLLLAGRQDTLEYDTNTGYTYGYMEAFVNSSGVIEGAFNEPGVVFPSTLPIGIGQNERFQTTIGKYPVKFFYQTKISIASPEPHRPFLFSSTYQRGVWSIRDRDYNGSPFWNAEN